MYRHYFRARVPGAIDQFMTRAARWAWSQHRTSRDRATPTFLPSPRLELTRVVYTSLVNLFDPSQNWQDLLTAYLLALRDREDATLVVQLVLPPAAQEEAAKRLVAYYRRLGLSHRCRLALFVGRLGDTQLVELARASTYYVNTSRAESGSLPLQAFLAAARPGIAPAHTAMADYFCDELGFVITSHPEPASWPQDPAQRCTTIRNRLVWQSLHDQILASYEIAQADRPRYEALATHGRETLYEYASAERVWPRLAAALNLVRRASGAR